jgi:hypothetical protein
MPSDTIAVTPTRMKHRPRFRRAPLQERPAFRLTDRDRELMKIIYENRFIPAGMLQDLVTPVAVTACNRNGPGLQSAHFWDHIICLYRPTPDHSICP